MIVDLHAHVMPADYLDAGRSLGGSYQDRFTGYADKLGIDQRLELMNEAGVARQVLSPTCAPYSLNEKAAADAACSINDHYAELVRSRPDRFDFWVSLPLPHVEAALAEIARGLDELGGKGVVLGCFCLGESIACDAFEPIYAELNRRGATIFLHPCQNGICSRHINEWGLTVCLGASLEDSLAAIHLIAAGIPSRYPRLRFIVPHFGGILPMQLERLDGQMPKDGLAELPSISARRFYYDTVGWGSRAALIAAIEAFGPSQIVTGSDFPILLGFESYKQTFDHIRDSGLDSAVVAEILANAAALLRVFPGQIDPERP